MSEYKKAPKRGLAHLRHVRSLLLKTRIWWLRNVWRMDIDPTVQLSMSAKLDRTFPRGVKIRAHSYLAFESRILTHDRTRGLYVDTVIEENCFIGGRSMILPGVTVGRGSIVGAGSVVTKDVPPGSIVVGNPAKILRANISVVEYGRLTTADATESELVEQGKL